MYKLDYFYDNMKIIKRMYSLKHSLHHSIVTLNIHASSFSAGGVVNHCWAGSCKGNKWQRLSGHRPVFATNLLHICHVHEVW